MPSKSHLRTPEAERYRRLYRTAAWRRLRLAQLRSQPLCQRCLTDDAVEVATIVHHRVAHKGDENLFWDPANLESLCAPHHDTLIQREEARGYTIGSDINGRPVDPSHPWNRS